MGVLCFAIEGKCRVELCVLVEFHVMHPHSRTACLANVSIHSADTAVAWVLGWACLLITTTMTVSNIPAAKWALH